MYIHTYIPIIYIYIPINLVCHINRLEGKNHMITLIGTENGFENPTLIHYRRPDEPRNRGNSSQHDKGHIQQTCIQHYTKWRKLQNI